MTRLVATKMAVPSSRGASLAAGALPFEASASLRRLRVTVKDRTDAF